MNDHELVSNYPRRVVEPIDNAVFEDSLNECESLQKLSLCFAFSLVVVCFSVGVDAAIIAYVAGMLLSTVFASGPAQLATTIEMWSATKRDVVRIMIALLVPIGFGWLLIRELKKIILSHVPRNPEE